MADVFDKEKRSQIMAKVRSKDTKPEMRVRKFLWHAGFRYRLHVRKLPGTPDIVLGKYKVAIFVHGCFWHGHKGCKLFRMPSTRRTFWKHKITRNIARDILHQTELKALGWRTILVWECEIRGKGREERMERLVQEILGGAQA